MNPYSDFSDLLFTCVNGPKADIVNVALAAFNKPDQWSPRDVSGEAIVQYFAKETQLDFSLAYVDEAERDSTKPQRVVFWEPRIHPGKTALMGVFHDGLSHSVFRFSEDNPFTWINVRIYEDVDYPGCFFDYYSDYRKTMRRLMACKDEEGWDFAQQGPVQAFENPEYYARRLKKDRLTREIITEYMDKLGFMIAHDDFWATDKPATFLWQERPTTTAEGTV
jgi:hypothetical protein